MSAEPASPPAAEAVEHGDRRRSVRPRLADPKYVHGSSHGEHWAHFPAGTVVRVEAGRGRAYPGLPSAAPSTLAFYREACRRFASAKSVLDAGSGAGIGTLELSGAFDHVIALDSDASAVSFARAYAPLARHVRGDLAQTAPFARVDACVVADVLGHVQSPIAVLRAARTWLDDERGEIFIAEPAASVQQRLDRPARRAFSVRALESLLVSAGLAVRAWVYQGAAFSALVAGPRSSDAWLDLARGDAAVEVGDLQAALDAYSRAEHSGDREVAAEAVLSRALALLAAGELENAAGVLMRASECLPGDPRPRAALSRIMLASESPEEALQLATIGVRLDPTVPEAAVALALAASALDHPDTISAWRIAHDLCPDDPFIASELAQLHCARSDEPAGIRAFERVRDYGDTLPAAFHVILARMLFAANRLTDARLEARMAAKLAPRDPDVIALVSELADAK